MSKRFERTLVSLGLFFIVLVTAPLYSVFPLEQVQALAIYYADVGFIECLTVTGEWATCPLGSLPDGYRLSFGLPMAIIASAFQRIVVLDVVSGYSLSAFLILVIGVWCTYSILRMFGAERVWSLAGTLLFFCLPILYGKAGYGFMMWGFVFFTVCVAATLLHWQSSRSVATSALLAIVMSLQVLQEPYSFVMAVSFGLAYSLVHISFNARETLTEEIKKGSGWVVSVIIAVLMYRRYIPESADYAAMPFDFYRGQGIDLIAFFARTTHLYWLDLPFGPRNLDPVRFYTDGEAVAHVYLGVGLLLGIVIFFLKSKFWVSPKGTSVVLVALCALLLALGPSLKINDQRPEPLEPPIRFNDYLMPKEAAQAELPHSFLYRLPPAKYMRSVSRWYLLFALMAVIMVTIGLSQLSKSGRVARVVSILIALIIALEHAPDYPAQAARERHDQSGFEAFSGTAVGELERMLEPFERVIFMEQPGVENEYLSLYLCASAGCMTYNAVTDKALARARKQWPERLRRAASGAVSERERADLLVASLQDGDLDAVVLPHFDMRWDSYSWPPDAEKVGVTAAAVNKTYRALEGVTLSSGSYFTVVRAAP